MTKEEIKEYANQTTLSIHRTEIIFNAGDKVYGYFEGNIPYGEIYERNEWLFVMVSKEGFKNKIVIKGDKIESITIHSTL